MKNTYLILVFTLFSFVGKSQNIGIGGSAIYNFQSETFGAGARINFFPNSTLSIVPQYSRSLFSLGPIPIREWTAGLSLELKVVKLDIFNFYLLGHGGYNSWINSGASAMDGASPTNWNAEAGIGVTTNKCLRPFLEYRYNIKFQETNLQIGLLYIFGCGNDGGSYRNPSRMKRGTVCPAYN